MRVILQLVSFLTFSVLAAADANTVINDFNKINNDLTTLDNDVQLVPSGVLGIGPALQVSVDAVTVDNDLIGTDKDVQSSSKFGASDSKNIVDVVQTVATSANKSLTDLTSKYTTFGGLAPVVLASLYQLRQDQNALGFDLYVKLDSSQSSRAVQIQLGLNAAFNNAIKAYGGTP